MSSDHAPPLILGATGRIGRAFRTLWRDGHWPGAREPLWQHRPGREVEGNSIAWDMAGTPPADYRLHLTRGIIVLAGATSGAADALAANTATARAALRLRDSGVTGPVLLMSSAAIYGRSADHLTEETAPTPANPYGAAKAEMEAAVAGIPGVTCLRLANVAGADMLFGAMAAGPVALDRFADGTAPRRSYIGPLTLARTLMALLHTPDLPPVLNVASPGAIAMDEVTRAWAGRWTWQPAPPTAIPEVTLDVTQLMRLFPLPPTSGAALVEEARTAGWTTP